MNLRILITEPNANYELLDSGDGEKLERYGSITLVRPDPQALWKKTLPADTWDTAHGIFSRSGVSGSWNLLPGTPDKWQMPFGDLKFWIKPSPFKHTGLFPEQSENWSWIASCIKEAKEEEISVLNLFGYTGGATLAAAHAGANVVHVDGSKAAVAWAGENAAASGLTEKPIRWIIDDARKFVRREIKRGKRYHGIIMDPPAFGHGKNGEIWKIDEDFLSFLELCKEVLVPEPLFVLINGYASGYSPIAYANSMNIIVNTKAGTLECGEVAIKESGPEGRLLPAGIFARWTRI